MVLGPSLRRSRVFQEDLLLRGPRPGPGAFNCSGCFPLGNWRCQRRQRSAALLVLRLHQHGGRAKIRGAHRRQRLHHALGAPRGGCRSQDLAPGPSWGVHRSQERQPFRSHGHREIFREEPRTEHSPSGAVPGPGPLPLRLCRAPPHPRHQQRDPGRFIEDVCAPRGVQTFSSRTERGPARGCPAPHEGLLADPVGPLVRLARGRLRARAHGSRDGAERCDPRAHRIAAPEPPSPQALPPGPRRPCR